MFFIQLKNHRKNKGLYDKIQLLEFARNFDNCHLLYQNSYLAISFYITILDSLIARPKICKCPVCGTEHGDGITWSKNFSEHYGEAIAEHLSIRNQTYHGAALFDWWEEWDRIDSTKGEEAWRKHDKVTFGEDLLEATARQKLLDEFLKVLPE